MYQVRFHLGAGANHRKWQVRGNGSTSYHTPEDVTLRLTACKLRNQPALARKIHEGADKDVCAWVDCESVDVLPATAGGGDPVLYNPRRVPYWTNESGDNLDNRKFDTLISDGRMLRVLDSTLEIKQDNMAS